MSLTSTISVWRRATALFERRGALMTLLAVAGLALSLTLAETAAA